MAVFLTVTGCLFLFLAISFAAYHQTFYATQKKTDVTRIIPKGAQYQAEKGRLLELIDRLDALPYEEVELTSKDGKRLTGRLYRGAEQAPLIIGFHGYKSNAVHNYCGIAEAILGMKCSLLLVNQRAHETSDGHTLTFGIKERFDCVDWAREANRQLNPPDIYLMGISMGAATVLMASELSLPETVRGIIADCPYSSPLDIIHKICNDKKIPFWLMLPFLWTGALVFGHFVLNPHITAANAVKNSRLPILILHGDADKFVPCSMSLEVRQAAPDRVEHHLFSGAGHVMSYLLHPDEYTACLRQFLDRTRST